MADQAVAKTRNYRNYTRTEEHSAATAARNRINKRKYPVGFDTKSRLYRIWRAMHFRCYMPSHKAFPRYGGRGIKVCSDWATDYPTFMTWALANGYAHDLTIDRKDNDLGYDPGNCRWITMRDQSRNKRDNIPPLTIFGETKRIFEWIEDPRCVVRESVLRSRVLIGWSPDEALTTPECDPKLPVFVTAFGETKRVADWAHDPRCAIPLASLYSRFAASWEPERAITEPARRNLPKDATHCFAGHEFTPENTATEPNGRRRCRECTRAKDRLRPRPKPTPPVA